MKRKVFSSLLLLVTMVAAGSMLFVSCKDYDDDINDLQNQITANATDLTSLVSEKVSNVTTEVSDLQAQSAVLQAAYEAADQALQATMEASIASALASANGYADTQAGVAEAYTDAQTAAANAYAEVQAAAAQAAAIAAAQDAVDEAASTLQAALSSATATLEAQGISIDGINSSLTSQGNSISELQANVTALVTADATLTEGITAAQARADEAYELAQSAQTLAETNKATLESLQATVESNNTTLQGQVDAVNTAVTANTSSIESLNTAVAGLQTSVSNLDSQISVLQGDVASALEQASTNASSIDALSSQLNNLSDSYEAFQTTLAEEMLAYVASLQQSISDGDQANADAIEALKTALTECLGKITDNSGSISTNAENIQKNADAIASLQGVISELEGSTSGSVENLLKMCNELSTKIDDNQTAIQNALNESVADLTSSISAALYAATLYADGAASDVADALGEDIATAQDAADAANASIEDLKDAYAAADEKLQDQIDELSGTVTSGLKYLSDLIDAANTQIETNTSKIAGILADYAKSSDLEEAQEAIDALKEELGLTSEALSALNNTVVSEYVTSVTLYDILERYLIATDVKLADTQSDLESVLTAALEDNATQTYVQEQLDALNQLLTDASNGDFSTLMGMIEGQGNDITDLQNNVDYLLSVAETHRLKSMVYVPSTYVRGVATINFLTFTYTAWTNVEADPGTEEGEGQEGGDENAIDDTNHTEEYFVNPSNVSAESIETLSFVSNSAKDTRVSSNAPISVSKYEITKDDDETVLRVTLKNEAGADLGSTNETQFTIVSLKATIADDFLTDDEKAAKADGEEVAVYSDWARVSQTTDTPYIHFANERDADTGKLIETEDDSHFWNFTTIYGGSDKTAELAASYNSLHMAEEQALYSEGYDLMHLVTVCNGNETEYTAEDLAAYGLEFKFEMEDTYYLIDEATGVYTNQELFARLDDDGHTLIATSRNGEDYNASAVGREPLVRVELIDTNNDDAIVDVRYFKIKWVAVVIAPEAQVYDGTLTYEGEFECEEFSSTLEKMSLNDVYSWLNDGAGMSQGVFRDTYTLYGQLFETEDAAKTESAGNAALGTVEVITNPESGQTDNIQWTLESQDLVDAGFITVDDLLAGTATIDAYVVYSTSGSSSSISGSRLVIPVHMDITIPGAGLAEGADYVNGAWGDNHSSVYVYPTEYTSRGTCEMSGNLLKDFTVDGDVCTDITDLVSSDDATPSFVFVDGNGFYATEDGTTLYYGVDPKAEDFVESENTDLLAATLDGTTGDIKLAYDENYYGTTGALALVGNKACVDLVADYCTFGEVTLKEFEVKFLEPLNISTATISKSIYDLSDTKTTSVSSSYYLKENWNTVKGVYGDYSDNNHSVSTGYSDFYGITGDNADNAGITNPYYDVPNSTWYFTGDDVTLDYADVSGYILTESDGKFTYERTIETALASEIDVTVPVTITTYWQTFEYTITIKIMPGVSGNGNLIKRK